MTWTSHEPLTQESCCCGAIVVVQANTGPLATERMLREFRDAHASCRKAWAKLREEPESERTDVCPICGRKIMVGEDGRLALHAPERFLSSICPGSTQKEEGDGD